MPFESVYRVSTRNSVPTVAEVDALARKLGMDLPVGYREFVTAFGPGTLSDFLIAYMPSEISSTPEELDRLSQVADDHREGIRESALLPEDIEQAVVFAHAAAEAPIWIASQRLGPRLFEEVEGYVYEIQDGFFGLVGICTASGQHEFPFFEPRNGRRRERVLAVRPGIGHKGFVDLMAERWGRESLRCSRSSIDELGCPHYFESGIEGHIELLLAKADDLPPDCFYARVRYDIGSERDFSAFVEPLLLPGGGQHDFIGEPMW
ncbi:MAG: SMI1/KNR4 family protein [Planctomycetes bacterium]|nr:SMI1/KNR4 family protein [Planctomycetota bacterium]